MKRFLSLFLIVLLEIIIYCPFALAALGDVTAVTSPMQRPAVSAVTSGSSTTYTCAFMRQTETAPSNEAPAGSYLNIVTFTIPSSMDVIFYPRNYNTWYLWVSAPILYDVEEYDIITGNLIKTYANQTSTQESSIAPDSAHDYKISPRQGYYPSQTVYNSHLLGAYYYLPPSVSIKTGSSQGYYADWVTWNVAPTPPSQTSVLHSFTSEPVYDYLNRYIVLGGASDGFIYHLGFYAPELTQYVNSTASAIQNTFSCSYFFVPRLTLDNSGLHLSLSVDPDLLRIWEDSLGGVVTYYDILISKYRLSDGQYISSSLYSGNVDDEYNLNYSFGSISDFSSVKTYGVQFIDASTSSHLNMLSCIWGFDPDFLTWRSSISSQLDNILSVLRGDGTQTTLPLDSGLESQVDDYIDQESAIFDRMDSAAGQIDNVFSEAESQFSTATSGFSFIRLLLETYVLGIPSLYIIVFFSLTFGLVVLIIGRSMGR